MDTVNFDYKKILDSLGNDFFYFSINSNRIFTHISSTVTQVLGYSQKEFQTEFNKYLTEGKYRNLIIEKIKSCFEGHQIEPFEIYLNHKNGKEIILEIKMITIMDDSNNVSGIQGIVHNITYKKIVNDTLYLVAQKGWKESGTAYFQSLVTFIGETFSLDYVFIDRLINDHKAITVGLYSHGSLQPELVYDLDGTPCENVLKCSLCIYKSKIQELFPKDILLQNMNADSYLGIPLWDSQGIAIGLIAVLNEKPLVDTSLIETVLQIVAVRTAHELERLQNERNLKASEEQLRTTLNSIGDGVITTDAHGIICNINPIAGTLSGWTKDLAINKELHKVLQIETDLKADSFQIQETIRKVIETGDPVYPEYHVTLINKNGNRYQISTLWSPLKNDEGIVAGVVLTFRNISEQIILQKQLAQSQKMDAIGQLAGGMAHDFNNVLNGIMSASQLLQLPKQGLNEKNLKYVDMIIQASIHASDLINNLLTFSRKGNILTTTLDIHKILNKTVDILERTIDKKITISVEKEARKYHLIGDRSAIESAFINLGINASHAMPNGGIIQIKTNNVFLEQKYCDSSYFEMASGEFLKIEIIDKGCGIPKQDLQKIFEPFYTTKEQGKGTGLGLSTVFGTIQDHNGSIEVHSEVGIGTTFNILLPCCEELTEKVKKTSTIINGIGTILLVDDEEMNRILNKDLLESLGYQVLIAKDGLESIEIFSNRHSEIDIIIMDMMMPKMNGSEAFYKLKEIDENCKVIIASGYIQSENIKKLIQNGLAGFINKPYKISEISQLLNDVLK